MICNKIYSILFNSKIILLTGTPIINTPREISILFNMLRGYIKTWTFQLQINTSAKINNEIILDKEDIQNINKNKNNVKNYLSQIKIKEIDYKNLGSEKKYFCILNNIIVSLW